jgi:hypothetical protein
MRFSLVLLALIPAGIFIGLAATAHDGADRILAIAGAVAVLAMSAYFSWKRQHGPEG